VPTELRGTTSLPAAWPSGVAKSTLTSNAVAARAIEIFELDIGFLPSFDFMRSSSHPVELA
jgi:hypothetical protein